MEQRAQKHGALDCRRSLRLYEPEPEARGRCLLHTYKDNTLPPILLLMFERKTHIKINWVGKGQSGRINVGCLYSACTGYNRLVFISSTRVCEIFAVACDGNCVLRLDVDMYRWVT